LVQPVNVLLAEVLVEYLKRVWERLSDWSSNYLRRSRLNDDWSLLTAAG
jgi:hypothetical protein